MVIACSSDDRTTPGVTPVPDAAPAVDPGASTDAGAAADAASPTPLPPVEGTLVAKAAGALTTTAELGDITLSGGSAQWRPRPSGGGVLTVTLIEAARTQRAFELSIFDDTGTLDPGETFPSVFERGRLVLTDADDLVAFAQASAIGLAAFDNQLDENAHALRVRALF